MCVPQAMHSGVCRVLRVSSCCCTGSIPELVQQAAACAATATAGMLVKFRLAIEVSYCWEACVARASQGLMACCNSCLRCEMRWRHS